MEYLQTTIIRLLAGIVVALMGFGVHEIAQISDSLVEIKVSLSRVVSQIEAHEKRLDRLERHTHP